MDIHHESLPVYPLKTRIEDDRREVWDRLRKRWMVLTPEEFVRQCLVEWLTTEKGIPTGLISIERGMTYNTLRKRYDLCVYDRNGKPLISIECKAPDVPLGPETLMQLSTYNTKLNSPFLLITNGNLVLFFGVDSEGVFSRQPIFERFEELL